MKTDDLVLFYDTETTGLPDFKAPSSEPHQPHLVQLGACLADANTREVLQTLDVIIQPDGWDIPDEVAKIHGITTEKAQALGVPEQLALDLFLNLWEKATVRRKRIGHNESFDARIIRIAIKRYHDDALADFWKGGVSDCTMQLAKPICNLPPTERMIASGRNFVKNPNLSEAHRHFLGTDFENAHSAIADVHACMAVYWAIQDHLNPPAPEQVTDWSRDGDGSPTDRPVEV